MSGAPLRKGWCPGVLRPMAAKDGLLVRLRVTGGILATATALALARLAETFGNGLLDLSARGNLQLRGIPSASWAPLVGALHDLDLLDADTGAEAVRNVLASPLAGLHEGHDIRPLVRALEVALVAEPAMRALPAKILWLVDDGSSPSLGPVSADLRFDWLEGAEVFSIGLGGRRDDAVRIGTCTTRALSDTAVRIARALVGSFREHPDVRRVVDLVRRLEPGTLASLCGGDLAPPLPAIAERRVTGPHVFHRRTILGATAPFGRLDARMLRAAAESATEEMRLTPWRTFLLPDVAPDGPALTRLKDRGFIVDPDDPRLHVSACVGQLGCERGTTSTQADAAALALVATDGRRLHVSGCAKGCAHPAVATVTLVGRDGRYDLVRDGRAGDAPAERGLDLAAVRALLA